MNKVMGVTGERGIARVAAAAAICASVDLADRFNAPHFRYEFGCQRPRDARAVIELRGEIRGELGGALSPAWRPDRLNRLMRELAAQQYDEAWGGEFLNLVPTGGADNLLDTYFSGSAYTAAFYMGLVDGTTAPTFAATDTMAAHAGWTENIAITQAARPTLAFSAAAARSKALSSAAVFNINAAGNIAGGFFATNSTLNGTTGTLYSAGAFTGGTKAVSSGDTLNVSATQAV